MEAAGSTVTSNISAGLHGVASHKTVLVRRHQENLSLYILQCSHETNHFKIIHNIKIYTSETYRHLLNKRTEHSFFHLIEHKYKVITYGIASSIHKSPVFVMKYCSLYFKIWCDIFITAKFPVWKHIHHKQHTPASYTLDRALLRVPTEICLLGDHSRFMTGRLVTWERERKVVNLPLLNWRIRVYLLWNLLPALRLLYGQPTGVRNVAVHRPCKSQLLSP